MYSDDLTMIDVENSIFGAEFDSLWLEYNAADNDLQPSCDYPPHPQVPETTVAPPAIEVLDEDDSILVERIYPSSATRNGPSLEIVPPADQSVDEYLELERDPTPAKTRYIFYIPLS